MFNIQKRVKRATEFIIKHEGYVTHQIDKFGVLNRGFGFTESFIKENKIDLEKIRDVNYCVQVVENWVSETFLKLNHTHFKTYQIEVLLSLIYNIGWGAFIKSTMYKTGKDRDVTDDFICQQLMRFVKVNGTPVNGLVNRRRYECEYLRNIAKEYEEINEGL